MPNYISNLSKLSCCGNDKHNVIIRYITGFKFFQMFFYSNDQALDSLSRGDETYCLKSLFLFALAKDHFKNLLLEDKIPGIIDSNGNEILAENMNEQHFIDANNSIMYLNDYYDVFRFDECICDVASRSRFVKRYRDGSWAIDRILNLAKSEAKILFDKVKDDLKLVIIKKKKCVEDNYENENGYH